VLANVRKKDFADLIRGDNQYVAWMTSLSCSEAGFWLGAIPKYHGNALPDSEFRTSLRTRLYIEHACII